MTVIELRRRLEWGLVAAVPVPHRGSEIAWDAAADYASSFARSGAAGVAVWAHTGRGPHLRRDDRRRVLDLWRSALPDRIVIAGATDLAMAEDALDGGADALLAFPQRIDPIAHHSALADVLPLFAFYLYDAAGGVSYDDDTLDRILALPRVAGIKVATLDSVMTFQRIARRCLAHPDTLLVTGEDRFLGYSLMCGARAALVGMGAALTDMQVRLLQAFARREWDEFITLSTDCDRFGEATFVPPMEGYVRRMLWAAAADGALPADACDDPWGPPLPIDERRLVESVVRDVGAARR